MITSKNFKSKRISLQLYEYNEKINDYIRINTMIHITEEYDSAECLFKRVSFQHDKSDKSFIMTMKNLEGLDMIFYMINTDSQGNVCRLRKITPYTMEKTSKS